MINSMRGGEITQGKKEKEAKRKKQHVTANVAQPSGVAKESPFRAIRAIRANRSLASRLSPHRLTPLGFIGRHKSQRGQFADQTFVGLLTAQ